MADRSEVPRIAPLEPPYNPDVGEMLQKWMPPGADIEPLGLFRTLGVHAELAGRMRPLGAGILGHGLVEPRLRELMIHRTCARCGAEYEWGVHAAVYGKAVGFSDEHLAATVYGAADDPIWSDAEHVVLRLADELVDTAHVQDDTFAELQRHFTPEQIIELVVTCGWYHTISYVIDTARVRLEPWAARFPVRVADAGHSATPRTPVSSARARR